VGMKKQWFQKENKLNKKEEVTTTISGRDGFFDMIKESQMPINIHRRQRIEEKKVSSN